MAHTSHGATATSRGKKAIYHIDYGTRVYGNTVGITPKNKGGRVEKSRAHYAHAGHKAHSPHR